MGHLELADEQREALTQHLREHIRDSRFPFASALRPRKGVLEKLDLQPEAAVVPSVADRYPVPASKRCRRRSP